MLVIRAFVANVFREEKIGEVHIQNMGEVGDGVFSYEIKKPKGMQSTFLHRRASGWMPLVVQVLSYLTENAKFGKEE